MGKTEELAAAISTFNKLFDKLDRETTDETARESLPDIKQVVAQALDELQERKADIHKEAQEEEEYAIGDAVDEIKTAIENLEHYRDTVDCPRCKGAGLDTLAVLGEHAGTIQMSTEEAKNISSLNDLVTWLLGKRDRPEVDHLVGKISQVCSLCRGRCRLPADFQVTLSEAIKGCWIHRQGADSLILVAHTPEIYTKRLLDAGLLCRIPNKEGKLCFTAKFTEEHMEQVDPEDSPIAIDDRHYRLRKEIP